jgi:hypothetical protein
VVETVSRIWSRAGSTPAFTAVGALFSVWVVVSQALDGDAAEVVGVVCFAVFVAYCVARPRGGFDVFLIACVPGATASLLHDLAHTPRWFGLVLVPLALVLAWHEDRSRVKTT